MLPKETELPPGSGPTDDPQELVRDLEDALPDAARLDTEVLLDMPEVSGHVVVGDLEVKCFVDRAGAVYLRCSTQRLLDHIVELEGGTRLKVTSATPVRLGREHWQRVEMEVA
jgi:hypothetical protein